MVSVEEALRIYIQANSYHSAGESLRKLGAADIDRHTYPSIHLGCIAAELYFKCLLKISGGPIRGHNLKNMFGHLPAHDRQRLNQMWDEYWESSPYKTLPPELSKFLPANKNLASFLDKGHFMFERSRYNWETKEGEDLYVLIELPRLLQSFILEKRPMWRG